MNPAATDTAARTTALLAELKTASRLPSPPGVAFRVLELCRRDDSERHEIADAVMSDPALAARLLRYANSPLLGGRRKVSSVLEAVLLLGLRATKLTALGFSLPLREFRPQCDGFSLPAFWTESFLNGVLARRVVAPRLKVGREDAFTAGLLAGLGRLVLATGLPALYARVLETSAAGVDRLTRERELLGVDHAEVGARVLREWQLPDALCDAIENQYAPEAAPQTSASLASAIRQARELADRLVDARLTATSDGEPDGGPPSFDDVDLGGCAPADILADVRQMASLFDIQLDDPQRCLDLLAEAREVVTHVGLLAEAESARLARAQRDLVVRATHDPLTGLLNRPAFEEQLEAAVRGLAREHGNFALLMVDLDGFKQVNDTRGHLVGDEVLRRGAAAIRSALRDVDVVARYGGDEFVVMVTQSDLAAATLVAERICAAVRNSAPAAEADAVRLTASIGIAATARYPHVPSARMLLKDADTQMYIAKRAGGDTWACSGACRLAAGAPARR